MEDKRVVFTLKGVRPMGASNMPKACTLGVPKSWFVSYGREGKSQNVIDLYQNKLNELQQQGFGASGQGIHERHARAMPMSVMRALPVAVRKSKNG